MTARGKEPAKPASAATKDDSGLIDLAALAAMEDSGSKNPVPTASIGLFALETPPIAVAPVAAAPTPEIAAPQPAKRVWIWGGAIAAVGLAAAAFLVGMHGGSNDQAQAAATTSTTEGAPPAAAAPAVLEAPAAADPGKVAAADPGALKDKTPPPAPSAAKPVAPTTGGHGPIAKASSGDKKSAGDAPKEEKKPASNDPCHGDLLCAMQRATGHK